MTELPKPIRTANQYTEPIGPKSPFDIASDLSLKIRFGNKDKSELHKLPEELRKRGDFQDGLIIGFGNIAEVIELSRRKRLGSGEVK
jgi:hypothetical protein